MKIGVYFCKCGCSIADKISAEAVSAAVRSFPGKPFFTTVDYICSENGREQFERSLIEKQPDRVVVAACSPRDHESTFRRCMVNAGLNPYLLQMVNIREQIAWVTEDPTVATEKAIHAIRGAVCRVRLQQPLEKKQLEICPDVLVIGAGPAGMKAALALAEAGRSVVLVERLPVIGGLAVRCEELFPALECGPCLLEPLMRDLLHGKHAGTIELLTLADVIAVNGFYGNFIATIRQRARHVSLIDCIGCGECVAVCPASTLNECNGNIGERKALDFAFSGNLPNVPHLLEDVCVRSRGDDCRACRDACPLGEQLIDLQEAETVIERTIGAIILATGTALYDASQVAGLGMGSFPDVYDGLQFERILASNGPTGGEIITASGKSPAAIAVIHCVGSLDEEHRPYCSGICCRYAFTFNQMISAKLPATRIIHYHRELVAPGKEAHILLQKAVTNRNSRMQRYHGISDLKIEQGEGEKLLVKAAGVDETVEMVVLCPAVVPAGGAGKLASLLDVSTDHYGFYRELHARTDAARSTLRGVYLAGSCQEPMDMKSAMLQGMATVGHVLAALQPGRTIEIEPIGAEVHEERCAGCRVCLSVCPYHAITFDTGKSVCRVNPVLCLGCGSCVAACPAGAMTGHHFTDAQILAEIKGVLK